MASSGVVDAEDSVVAEAAAVVADVDGEADLGQQTTHPALQALVGPVEEAWFALVHHHDKPDVSGSRQTYRGQATARARLLPRPATSLLR